MDLANGYHPNEVTFNKEAYGVGAEVQAHQLIPTAEAKKFEPFFQTLANHTDGAFDSKKVSDLFSK